MPIKYSRMVQQSMGVSSGSSADRPISPSVGEQFVNGTLGITEVYTENDGWQPLTSSSTGIPYGTTADRPANPELGQPFFNADEARLELYTSATGWQNIVQETPSVVSISGIYLESNPSNTITVNGTNFASGAIAYAIGTDGVEIQADVTTLVSVVEISATFSGLVPANEPYDIKVVNPSNLYGVLYETLQIDDIPVFITQSGTLGAYIEESPMSVQISVTDDENSPLIFSVSSGSLPAGLSLNASTGEISGTPADIIPNTTYSFDISATDGNNVVSRSFSITINDRGPTWSTSETLSAFTKNIIYSETLTAVDDNLQTVSYNLVAGSLPTGLTLNSTTGEISGTPTSDIIATFTIRATDTNSGSYSDKQFTMPNPGPSWQTGTGIPLYSNESANFQLSAIDDSGIAPSYSLSSGQLPAGITLSEEGILSGTPTEAGEFSVVLTATDNNGSASNRSFVIYVTDALISEILPNSGSSFIFSWDNAMTAQPNQLSGWGDVSGNQSCFVSGFALTATKPGAGVSYTTNPSNYDNSNRDLTSVSAPQGAESSYQVGRAIEFSSTGDGAWLSSIDSRTLVFSMNGSGFGDASGIVMQSYNGSNHMAAVFKITHGSTSAIFAPKFDLIAQDGSYIYYPLNSTFTSITDPRLTGATGSRLPAEYFAY